MERVTVNILIEAWGLSPSKRWVRGAWFALVDSIQDIHEVTVHGEALWFGYPQTVDHSSKPPSEPSNQAYRTIVLLVV